MAASGGNAPHIRHETEGLCFTPRFDQIGLDRRWMIGLVARTNGILALIDDEAGRRIELLAKVVEREAVCNKDRF